MPLIPFENELIEVDVNDRIGGAIAQKARFVKLVINQDDEATKKLNVVMDVIVSMYNKNQDGTTGDRLEGKGFGSYAQRLVADNDTIVDAQTGSVLLVRTNESPAQWQAAAEAYQEAVMFQGDFFLMLRDTQQIPLKPMIIQHITAGIAMGKYQ